MQFANGGGAHEIFRDCPTCPQMTVVPAGSYLMGSPESEEGREGFEWPRHEVRIEKPFAVGVYPVTFEEWDACAAEGGCGGYRPNDEDWGRGRRPVVNVSWDDAQSYVIWLRRKTGKPYRLLSEAEWEYAARAGTTTRYSFGDAISTSEANYGGALGETQPVGSYRANGFGLHDMHGNVWEWVQDRWHDDYDEAPNDGTAWETQDIVEQMMERRSGSRRVLRGGSWSNDAASLRSAARSKLVAGSRGISGFRVARALAAGEESA